MAVFVGGAAILGGLTGIVAWFNSLPSNFKYIIFLAGLSADAGLTVMAGFGNGIIATPINLLLQNGFGFPVTITSFQLLIVFIMLPIMFYCLSN